MTRIIMTVDDSASMRQMVSFTLRKADYQVVEAVDGQDAVNKLEQYKLDMLITDLNMPNMDGIELIKKVRIHPHYQYIPIIIVTTESQTIKKLEGKAAGATGWIVKPFKPEQLLTVIKRVLR